MSELFDGLLKPGAGAELALRRELERRRDAWTEPGYLYRGAGDYLLQHGRFYPGRPLPDGYDRGAPSACFPNAMTLALSDPTLRYVEGVYGTGPSAFTPHAWCLDADDGVLEVTLPTHDLGRYHHQHQPGLPFIPPERWGYWGVILSPELVQWFAETYGEFCLFDRPTADKQVPGLDMSQSHDWPILRVPYDPSRTSL